MFSRDGHPSRTMSMLRPNPNVTRLDTARHGVEQRRRPFASTGQTQCHSTPLLHSGRDGCSRLANLCLVSGMTFTASQTPSRKPCHVPTHPDRLRLRTLPHSQHNIRSPSPTRARRESTKPLFDAFGTRAFFFAGCRLIAFAGRQAGHAPVEVSKGSFYVAVRQA